MRVSLLENRLYLIIYVAVVLTCWTLVAYKSCITAAVKLNELVTMRCLANRDRQTRVKTSSLLAEVTDAAWSRPLCCLNEYRRWRQWNRHHMKRCSDPQRGMTNGDRETDPSCSEPRSDAEKQQDAWQRGAGDEHEAKGTRDGLNQWEYKQECQNKIRWEEEREWRRADSCGVGRANVSLHRTETELLFLRWHDNMGTESRQHNTTVGSLHYRQGVITCIWWLESCL